MTYTVYVHIDADYVGRPNCWKTLSRLCALTNASHAGGVESHSRWALTAERTASVDAEAASLTHVRKHRAFVHIYSAT